MASYALCYAHLSRFLLCIASDCRLVSSREWTGRAEGFATKQYLPYLLHTKLPTIYHSRQKAIAALVVTASYCDTLGKLHTQKGRPTLGGKAAIGGLGEQS